MDGPTASHALFTPLVAEHQGWLRAYVRSLGVVQASVDDVAQEVFLVAFRRFAEYDAQRPFAAWLKGIAKLVAANERRRQQRRRLVDPSLAEALAAVDEEDDEDLAQATRHLGACMELLPQRSRELLRLRYEQDRDAASLGALLGRDANAVRQALFRIREVIRRCLEQRIAGARA